MISHHQDQTLLHCDNVFDFFFILGFSEFGTSTHELVHVDVVLVFVVFCEKLAKAAVALLHFEALNWNAFRSFDPDYL